MEERALCCKADDRRFFAARAPQQVHKGERPMSAITVLIVDDNAGFRSRVREILALKPDVKVAGEAADGREAIRKARQLKPNLVLMDVRMPEICGIDATAQLKREVPETEVIILTRYDLEEYRKAAAASGASGYVVKESVLETLLPTIQEICAAEEKQRDNGRT
jgi:DNA-binding NarL/FixJ family response regulator